MTSITTPRWAGVVALAAVAGIALGACSSSSKETSSSNPTTIPSTAVPTADAMANETIVGTAAANPDFSTLVSAVKAGGLAETLSGAGPFTVFAPTNEAFAKLPPSTLASLLKPENKQQLADILTYHVVPAQVMAADVKAGKVKTANGSEFTVATNGGTVVITDGQGNKAKVVKTDIAASNGVIHVIDTVLLPPKN